VRTGGGRLRLLGRAGEKVRGPARPRRPADPPSWPGGPGRGASAVGTGQASRTARGYPRGPLSQRRWFGAVAGAPRPSPAHVGASTPAHQSRGPRSSVYPPDPGGLADDSLPRLLQFSPRERVDADFIRRASSTSAAVRPRGEERVVFVDPAKILERHRPLLD